MDWSELFFSGAGRAARGPSLVAVALLIAVAGVFETVGPTVHWLVGWLVYPLLFFCACCVLSKRLHDRGRSGWWSGLIILAAVALWPGPDSVVDVIFALVLIWAAVELGAMPGEEGANRYGPNPLRPLTAS